MGKAETAFLPGVRVGTELAPTSAAARGGVLPGDVITRVGDLQVPAGPSQVGQTRGAPGRVGQGGQCSGRVTVERWTGLRTATWVSVKQQASKLTGR